MPVLLDEPVYQRDAIMPISINYGALPTCTLHTLIPDA